MPLFEGALGTALFAKGAAAGKGVGLLAGLLNFPAPTLHLHDHSHDHSHDARSFLDVHATLAPSSSDHAVHAAAASQQALHSDFLFGASPSGRRHFSTLRLLPKAAPAAAGIMLAAPKLSMMAAGAGGAATSPGGEGGSSLRKAVASLDPFGENPDSEETGWCKFVPRGLKIALASDIISALVLAGSYFDSCDWPLKAWLFGGIFLGYPVSSTVHKVASRRPAFKFFRLRVKKIRGSGLPPELFKLEGLVLYDQFNHPIPRADASEVKDDEEAFWEVSLNNRGDPELITGYHLITHQTANIKYDPISWQLEASADRERWRIIHVIENKGLPSARGAETPTFDDLRHLEDATSAFRSAFLTEVFANAMSFAWLVAGTAWVSAGTDTCVDSAPFLWFFSYITVVIVWSFIGTITVGLIVSAVAMVLLGSRPGS